ncbi:hypothetical protein H0H93_013197 [Arthromyces matolae]|nr:hypothetical protein H0H93_013197 [Arthromyces matolae]
MSLQFNTVEQDQSAPNGQEGLPTYDDLAAQHGPNSRAAERYADITPQERARRRARGWGNDEMVAHSNGGGTTAAPPFTMTPALHVQTEYLNSNAPIASSSVPRAQSPPLPILPLPSKRLSPTHLKINQFGSRFLPHTNSPIRCLLPIEADKLLLIGHDEGLSVLDMFPEEWSEDGDLTVKGPDEAQARLIWSGESVIEMSLLEVESSTEGAQHGVVLALVGSQPDAKETDSLRALRMYNLSSLVSLAKWTISQKGAHPLDLRRPSNWQVQQTPSKRSRRQSRGSKAIADAASIQSHDSSSPVDVNLSPASTFQSSTGRLSPNRRDTDESSWDVVDDLPLRWATDFVPLATAGSRLLNSSVISYALWKDETRKGRGGRLLAIATKSTILLYETPKGERAFRFVKDVNRSAPDVVNPPKFFGTHRRSDSANTIRATESSRASASSTILDYGTHLCLFVIFDKKAGWIRLADSAVGEIELFDVGQHRASEISNSRRSRMSFEATSYPSKWIPPIQCALPLLHQPSMTKDITLVTKGTTTHILPSPLPVGPSPSPPLFCLIWRSPPTCITTRISKDSDSPFLQVIGLGGENGVEVQEIPILSIGTGKVDGVVRAEEDLGGEAGFLCTGGHWDQAHNIFQPRLLHRSFSAMSIAKSFASLESEDLLEKMKKEQGVYAWCRKGLEDWRVLWIGGPLKGSVEDVEDD